MTVSRTHFNARHLRGRVTGMPKALCIAAMVVAILVFILFFVDLTVGFFGQQYALAPFKGARPLIDIVFSISAGILGYMAWATFREQK